MLDTDLALRTRFAAAPAGPGRQVSLLSYLRITSSLIDLAGRMRYQLRDALGHAAHQVAGRPDLRDRLIELLIQNRSGIGAALMSAVLFPAPPDRASGAVAPSAATKARLLELIAVTGEFTQLAQLADLARRRDTPGELVVLSADAIRRVGLPQDERPGGGAASRPDEPPSRPPITAASLYELVERANPSQLSGHTARLREGVLTWLAGRKARGLEDESYRLGAMELRPGDWLLMRNPSPYNLFMVTKTYNPSLNLHQELRLKLVELADHSSVLADAIRQNQNVGTTTDLVAAARVQTVVETLEGIAFGSSRQYLDAFTALTGGDPDTPVGRGSATRQPAELNQLRNRHADLYRQLQSLTPRQLRIELVNHYIGRGEAEIDRRFFQGR
jgi:hypothetical protein